MNNNELYSDILDALTSLNEDSLVIYVTPSNSIRCYDLEDSNKTLRNENGVILHDNSLLDWLLNLVPSN